MPDSQTEPEMTTKEAIELYRANPNLFFADFWGAGNSNLNIAVEPHSVQSGRWYTATWQTQDGGRRCAEAQWWGLVWERIIKRFLQDEYEARRPTEDSHA